MPTELISAPELDLIAQPLPFKPTVSDTAGAVTPDNSEIRKIAEDVFNGLTYSFASVAANLDETVRTGSLEETVQQSLKEIGKTKPEKLENVRKTAGQLVSMSPANRKSIFGRYGEIDSKSLVSLGMDRAVEGLPALAIDKKLLGVRTPVISLPVDILRPIDGGLLVPTADLLQAGEFESAEAMMSQFEESTNAATASSLYGAEKLADTWGPLYQEDPYLNGNGQSDFEAAAVTDKLSFHITKVKCVDETNPEFWGSDEIALAGVTVDETGDTKKVNERYIGGGFDDGDVKSYSPHWQYTWFNMREEHNQNGTKWPKTYQVALILAEKDNGGLSSFLHTVWLKIRDQVKLAIEKAIGAVLASYLGPKIAEVIGKVVAWVIDKFVGWLIGLFKDDIFPPVNLSCTVPSYHARWILNGTWGSTTSGLRRANFTGHGGRYYVEYYWKLSA